MIYTVIADYKKLSFEEATNTVQFSSLPPFLREYIKDPRNEEVRLSRLGGYLLLYHTVRFLFGKENFDVAFSENGKPAFASGVPTEGLSFNLSHSGGMCAVTVSDGGEEVGVDLQERIDRDRVERLKERFMNYSLKDLDPTEPIVYLFGAFSLDGNCMFAEIPYRSLVKGDIKEEATDMWSLTEAILKCHGGGFCQAKEIMKELSGFASETVRFNYKGKLYSISTVTKK